MGNEQSNERKRNYKVYKITRVDGYSDWERCHLDGYVPYNNGNYNYMDFEKLSNGAALMRLGASLCGADNAVRERAVLSEGWYIAIDIDWTRNFSSSKNFSAEDVKTVGSPSSSFPGEGGFQGLVGEISEARERYARTSEWANFDKQMQRSWQLQPPKK